MGYHTDFNGTFKITPTLKPEHRAYLDKFAQTRRMARDAMKTARLPDPLREAVGLPHGPQGAYFVNEGAVPQGTYGYDSDVTNHNGPPSGQPGLWCQWTPSEDGTELAWDGGEKFYDYVAWLNYLIAHFLGPWGYKLNGTVEWQGENASDTGRIVVKDSVVETKTGKVVYDEDESEATGADDEALTLLESALALTEQFKVAMTAKQRDEWQRIAARAADLRDGEDV